MAKRHYIWLLLIRYPVCWEVILTFTLWLEKWGYSPPDNSSDYLPKLSDIVLFITFGRRHMTKGDQWESCTISHSQSQPVRRRTTAVQYRTTVKQRRTELSYTVCKMKYIIENKGNNIKSIWCTMSVTVSIKYSLIS